MNDKRDCLVLSIKDYHDNDLLLQTICHDGIFSFSAKGAKKITSKKHYMVSCLYEMLFDYVDNKTLFSIHNSKLVKSYYDDNNLKMMAFKNILFEITLKAKELFEEDLYLNLLFVLDNITDDNLYLLGSLYFSYMFRLFGISPNVDECTECGNKNVVAISNHHGGFLCLNHATGEKLEDIETLKKFRLIVKAQFKDYEVIKNIKYNLYDFSKLVDFFMINADLKISAYDFYKTIV